ncbi:MAG: protein kinase [Rhodospirillaceae bacterium]|nr:protein kinase [Rhodospirillaceae bacterium]MDG1274071.1 CpaF family protein [Alphaproteobacteria bacterium]MDG1887546.1 CpaF family protein [Alphaproteobacteria bacterium]|tara:strand:- start:2248 stop:3720 length:1473 start_codon:yes stop_codon:yes gene_type:complete
MKSFGKKTALDEVSLEDKVTVQSPIIVNEKNNSKATTHSDLDKNIKRAVSAPDNSSETKTSLDSLLLDTKLQETKILIFNDLIDAVELSQLTNMADEEVRDEISDVVSEIIVMRQLILSATEQRQVIESICDDVLGLGPLEPLMNQDDISDIMVNHSGKIYIERNGKIELTEITFRDNAQLMNICQRIVTAVGRRVDEASPICDARLMDGSRVNVIARPLAIDGAALTIRKFQKQKLTLDNLVSYGSVSKQCAQLLEVIGACRLNILVSGGTGSGKTTLLNCLTNYIDSGERVITCEDAAELQLKNPHVVRLETRPPNIEGSGEISMRDLVKNCLRMRPDRIIVGEVRGSEAFDLLQAMNTGHDGSMGTVHANNPRESISRIENMIAMSGFNLPSRILREQISSAVNIIVQATRLRDGSRKITHVTEVIGMEEDIITLQDLFTFEIEREDENGKLIGKHVYSGLRPSFWEKARYFGLESKLNNAINISQN